MKRFIFLLILLLSISFSLQAKTSDYETPDSTVVDQCDADALQIATIDTNQGNSNDCKRFDIFYLKSNRYHASHTASRHSKNIGITTKTYSNTNYNKEQARYGKLNTSRQHDRSTMRMRRVESSGKNLQGNHTPITRNKYKAKRNFSTDTKRNELYAKTAILHRFNRAGFVFRHPVCSVCNSRH